MQFQKTWDSAFDKIAQDFGAINNNFYQSQLASSPKIQAKGISVYRQQARAYNTDELVKLL